MKTLEGTGTKVAFEPGIHIHLIQDLEKVSRNSRPQRAAYLTGGNRHRRMKYM